MPPLFLLGWITGASAFATDQAARSTHVPSSDPAVLPSTQRLVDAFNGRRGTMGGSLAHPSFVHTRRALPHFEIQMHFELPRLLKRAKPFEASE